MAAGKQSMLLAMLAPKDKGMGAGGSKAELPPGAAEPVDDMEMVASDIMGAIRSKDATAFAESLKAFVNMC